MVFDNREVYKHKPANSVRNGAVRQVAGSHSLIPMEMFDSLKHVSIIFLLLLSIET